PQLHGAHLEDELGPHVPLLADVVQHPHLRGHVLLRPAEDRPRTPGPGARGRDVQGVRPSGQQHAGGDADDARVASRHGVPPERPGDPAAPPAQDGPSVRERVPATDGDTRPGLGRVLSEEPEMPTLPAEFADLEPFADWAIATERERYAKRLSSTMDELQAFYDSAFPRLEAASSYLDQFDMGAMPDEA